MQGRIQGFAKGGAKGRLNIENGVPARSLRSLTISFPALRGGGLKPPQPPAVSAPVIMAFAEESPRRS